MRKRVSNAFRRSCARSSPIGSRSTRRSTVKRRSPSTSCARSASRCLSTSRRNVPSSSMRSEMTPTLALPLLQQVVSDTGYTYGHFPGIGGRGAVWVAAEVHLMFAAFVLGVPMFAVITELIGIVAKRSEEHTSELQSPVHLVCRLLLEKKKKQHKKK